MSRKNYTKFLNNPEKWSNLVPNYNEVIKIPRPPKGSYLINPTIAETKAFQEKILKQA